MIRRPEGRPPYGCVDLAIPVPSGGLAAPTVRFEFVGRDALIPPQNSLQI